MANPDVTLSPYAKVKVYWDDRPENYSKEAKNKIRGHLAKKYGFNKNNIDIIYRPVKISENGDVIEINGANIENIMDVNYQRELMKEWIKRENKIIDFNRLIGLDEKVNAELNIENDDVHHKSWSVRWIMIDNFLSFGEKNYLPFNKLKGLTIVNSMPANTGGKTTLTIDTVNFLLHGKTTKTDKNEDIFNAFSDKNELVVRGMVDIADEELIIERKMTRKAKKTGEWTVTNKVNYYRVLPDGEEVQLNEDDATKTTIKLEKVLGNEKDFELLVLATERNLDDLIGLTTTQSGKILTRLIGLEILELKEEVVRKMFNKFEKEKKSNNYDVVTLSQEITSHEEKIVLGTNIDNDLKTKRTDVIKEISDLNIENDRLLNSKITIDAEIKSLNPANLEKEIKDRIDKGILIRDKVAAINLQITALGKIEFDEDKYHQYTKEINEYNTQAAIKESQIKTAEQSIANLVAGGICQACKRKLDDVDNTTHIDSHKKTIEKLKGEIALNRNNCNVRVKQLSDLEQSKKDTDTKNKLELERDRGGVEMDSLRNSIKERKNDLTKYNLNQEAILHNERVEMEVIKGKTKLEVANRSKDDFTYKIDRIEQDLTNNKTQIEAKTKLIEQIKKETEVEKIYKVYIDLVGKKGISKLVLRSVLPIINAEVARLLDEVVDFEVEIFIDDKNDVQFLLNKDGVSKALKSGSGLEKTAASLALRGVLGKLSTLPMPNFITFDEIFGKIANENLEKIKPLFDKLKGMYEIVFLITHNDIVKDWGDNIVTVQKEHNISKITLK